MHGYFYLCWQLVTPLKFTKLDVNVSKYPSQSPGNGSTSIDSFTELKVFEALVFIPHVHMQEWLSMY